MDNASRIVGGIANIAKAVDKRNKTDELVALLNLFGLKTKSGEDRVNLLPNLIETAKEHYSNMGDQKTVENIMAVFQNIDISLLE